MRFKTFYKIYSLIISFSAVMVLLWGIFLGLFFDVLFQLHEPIIIIAVIEVFFGFSVIPFYFSEFKKLKEGLK